MIRERERRSVHRFPLKLLIRYRILGESNGVVGGVGRTIDISSSGFFVSSKRDPPIRIGLKVAAVVEWPPLLDSAPPSHLFITGRVVRSDKHGFAISFMDYEFRTLRSGQRWLRNKLSRKSADKAPSEPNAPACGAFSVPPLTGSPHPPRTTSEPEAFFRGTVLIVKI